MIHHTIYTFIVVVLAASLFMALSVIDYCLS
jgi:hypothetical protein